MVIPQVCPTFPVYTSFKTLTQADAGRAEDVIAGLPMIRWRQGSGGDWLRGSFARVRCWRVDGQGRRRIGWLIAQRELPDGSGRNKWHWANFPANTPLERLVELAHRRHHIERFHEEAKTLLGWDQLGLGGRRG